MGDIVVTDNLSSHKVAGITGAITASGALVLYLPPYSADLNPIELKWAKIKTFLKKARARTPDLLESAISQALSPVSPADILTLLAGFLIVDIIHVKSNRYNNGAHHIQLLFPQFLIKQTHKLRKHTNTP